MKKSNPSFTRDVFKILLPYWKSEKKWEGLSLLAITLGSLTGFVFLQLELNIWGNLFYTAIQEVNLKAFLNLLVEFTWLAFASIATFLIAFYAQQHLLLRWWKWLTNFYIQKWLENKNYYHLLLHGSKTDNPDQRIADDIHRFCFQTLTFFFGFFQKVLTLVTFFGVLWALSGTLRIPLGSTTIEISGYMFWGGLIYAVIGSFISIKLGRPLIHLSYTQERREADLRYSLIRFRDHAEGIAFHDGEQQESQTFKDRFSYVYDNFTSIIRTNFFISGWLSFYNQSANIFPMLLVAPRYFSHQVTFGALMQTLSACNHVYEALFFLVNQYPNIAEWSATTNRLLVFLNEMESLDTLPKDIQVKSSEDLKCHNLTVNLPQSKVLLDNLNLQFIPGEHTLITGPSGIGKSTFMRSLAGIWPFGKGEIHVETKGLMFLPQKPYMPLGTLKQIISYPSPAETLPESEFVRLLGLVELNDLAPRLSNIEDWNRVLSLGEQQRISILRAIIAKPKWLLMDEATSSLDTTTEKKIMDLLHKSLPETTFISVGHRQSLTEWHTRVIDFQTI